MAPYWNPTKHFVVDVNDLSKTRYGPLVQKAYRMAKSEEGPVPLLIRVVNKRPQKVLLGAPHNDKGEIDVSELLSFTNI